MVPLTLGGAGLRESAPCLSGPECPEGSMGTAFQGILGALWAFSVGDADVAGPALEGVS